MRAQKPWTSETRIDSLTRLHVARNAEAFSFLSKNFLNFKAVKSIDRMSVCNKICSLGSGCRFCKTIPVRVVVSAENDRSYVALQPMVRAVYNKICASIILMSKKSKNFYISPSCFLPELRLWLFFFLPYRLCLWLRPGYFWFLLWVLPRPPL